MKRRGDNIFLIFMNGQLKSDLKNFPFIPFVTVPVLLLLLLLLLLLEKNKFFAIF
jgi:hypothetical protein